MASYKDPNPLGIAPGPQNPGKYPRTGPSYAYYGEVNGYIYNPWTDRYVPDPNAVNQYEISQGLKEKPKKPPSLTSTVGTGAGILALGLGVKGVADAGGVALGDAIFGATPATAATQATGTAAGAAGSAGSSSGMLGGLFGGGSSSAAPAVLESTSPVTSTIPYSPGFTGPMAGEAGVVAPSGGMFSLGGIGSAGNVILPAVGAIGAYDVLSHEYGPARSGIEGAASGAAIGSYFGPQGALIGAGVGGLLGLGKSYFNHESTRDIAKKHTGDLLSQGKDDPTWQNYVSAIRAQYNAPPPDPSKPYLGGKYGSFDEYKNAGLVAADLTGVYGNLKTFGPEWTKLTPDQQLKVTQGIINAGLYESDHGEVVITDPNKARDIKNQVISGAIKPSPTSAQPTGLMAPPAPTVNPEQVAGQINGQPGQPQPLPAQYQNLPYNNLAPVPANMQPSATMPPVQIPKRSTTLSPGIGLNGQPVYSRGLM